MKSTAAPRVLLMVVMIGPAARTPMTASVPPMMPAMFGMTIPLRKAPNLWTFTLRLVPPDPPSPLAALACAIILLPFR
jgi:hypothetical protein